MDNKVTFGFSFTHYAIYLGNEDGAHKWEKPIAIPGAVSFSPTSQGTQSIFYADNIAYYIAAPESGKSGDLEMALFPDQFLIDVLGWQYDDNGALVEIASAAPVPFALLCQVEGNVEPIRNIYFICTGSAPVDGYTTNTNNITVATKKMAITAVPVRVPGLDKLATKASVKASKSPAAFAAFFDAVYMPAFSGTAQGASFRAGGYIPAD